MIVYAKVLEVGELEFGDGVVFEFDSLYEGSPDNRLTLLLPEDLVRKFARSLGDRVAIDIAEESDPPAVAPVHGLACPCDPCVSGRKRSAEQSNLAFHRVVGIAAALKLENARVEVLYKQADEDRLVLLNIAASLATVYHDHGASSHETLGHAVDIAECTHAVCATAREGLLSIGKDRSNPANAAVQSEIDA